MYQFTQHKFWGVLALIISIMFVAFMVNGCGNDDDDDNDTTNDDDDDTDTTEELPIAKTVTVDPAPNSTVPSTQAFTLTFDEGVTAATVNGTAATGAGLNWAASPALTQGAGQSLNVEWTNRDGSTGTQAVGPYTIDDPDIIPPAITTSTVADGDSDVDPAPINAGGFRFDFDEVVTGTIKLTDEAGADLNWIATVGGQTATLTAVAGQELANETTYKVELDVNDGSNNNTTATITFVTKPKE